MIRPQFRHAVLLAAVLVLAIASIASAARMAPERADPALAAHMTVGGTIEDLCDGSPDHEHRCPFCRLLADPPDLRFAPCFHRAAPSPVRQDLGHLVAHPQGGNPRISARAPPAPV